MTPRPSPFPELPSAGRPPAPPRVDGWPPAVRSAELLRGTLVRCGPGARLAAWPESPRVRAAALAPWTAPDRIAIAGTAAWIWGAARHPGTPLELSTARGRRPPLGVPSDVRLRQFRFRPGELAVLDGLALTTPLRTAADLLRAPAPFAAPHRATCRLLLRLVDGGAEAAGRVIAAERRPSRGLALERLARL